MSDNIGTARICDKCIYLKYVGDIMVGSVESGGPEPSYRCLKNRNLSYYMLDRGVCPDADDGDEPL